MRTLQEHLDGRRQRRRQSLVLGGRLVAQAAGDELEVGLVLGPVALELLRLLLDEAGAFLELGLDVLAGVDLGLRLVAPGRVQIGPRLDDELVRPEGGGNDRRRPPVKSGVLDPHRRLGPRLLVARAPHHPGGQDVVAVLEHVRAHHDVLADHDLGRVLAGERARADVVDHDASDHPRVPTTHHPSPKLPLWATNYLGQG